ncbi:SDR family oxidoreductase [Methanoregula sp.]|jgi:UDP-glucose 4-epimerase|uniref:SDR family oxidoreductase n=1 Tax=Methanoregula sp. TaxID=2052170 RepID=UPI0035651486
MKYLVTGGAGFIGSHIIERLLHQQHDVICLDNFDPYYDPKIKERNISSFPGNERFTLIHGDILDKKLLHELLIDVDVIFHEAAQAGVPISTENPLKSHEVNATGTLNLLESAVKANIKRFIYASSSSVYGTVKYLPFDEDHPTYPVSPYGVSKLMAEHYCRVFSELYGLPSVALRYFTVYGPRMRPDLAINIFTRQALKNEPLTIFGTGDKTRDFTYIDDIINANLISLVKGNGVYNIGGGHRVSIQELAEKIIEITGSSSIIQYKESKKGDAEHTYANTTKAQRELGWKPKTSLEQGLTRYIEWVSTYQ